MLPEPTILEKPLTRSALRGHANKNRREAPVHDFRRLTPDRSGRPTAAIPRAACGSASPTPRGPRSAKVSPCSPMSAGANSAFRSGSPMWRRRKVDENGLRLSRPLSARAFRYRRAGGPRVIAEKEGRTASAGIGHFVSVLELVQAAELSASRSKLSRSTFAGRWQTSSNRGTNRG